MAFITINEGFLCEVCGEKNPPAEQTCRNHCRRCLSSKHVDDVFPGDRESECAAVMNAVDVQVHAKHDLVIVHECEKCKKTIQNKVASDDSQEKIYEVQQKKAESFMK